MKLGFVTAILQDESFEEVVDFASEHGFSCIEVACWPKGKAERRYAGVTHIDVDVLDDKRAEEIKAYCSKKNVEISSLAYYPNTLDRDPEKRTEAVTHLKKVIKASAKLGVNMVTTFIGRVTDATVEENLEVVAAVWPDILKEAERENVKVAIENCPMLSDRSSGREGRICLPAPPTGKKFLRY